MQQHVAQKESVLQCNAHARRRYLFQCIAQDHRTFSQAVQELEQAAPIATMVVIRLAIEVALFHTRLFNTTSHWDNTYRCIYIYI